MKSKIKYSHVDYCDFTSPSRCGLNIWGAVTGHQEVCTDQNGLDQNRPPGPRSQPVGFEDRIAAVKMLGEPTHGALKRVAACREQIKANPDHNNAANGDCKEFNRRHGNKKAVLQTRRLYTALDDDDTISKSPLL